MSLNWNVPLKNGKDVFFTEESFNKFNNYTTFEERFLKRLEDHEAVSSKGGDNLTSSSKASELKQESPAPVSIKKEPTVMPVHYKKQTTDDRKQNKFPKEDKTPSSLKLASHITKGRLPPPRKSSLCHADQKLYLSLYSKYGGHSPADPTEEEITELNKLKVLQVVVTKEQEEYHAYSQSLAKALEGEYHYMDSAAKKYMESRLSARRHEVETYPSQYNIVSSFTLKGTGQASQLTYIKPLLQLGSVPKMIIPTVTYDRRHQLPVDTAAVSQQHPVRSDKKVDTSWNHEACSMDQNAEILAVQHRSHVVISPGALMCLVDNHTPHYSRDWELPFSVKEYDVIEGEKKVRHRIVYIDKPFPTSNMTERTMNTKFYKFLLRHIFCPHQIKDQTLDKLSTSVDSKDKRQKEEEKESISKKATTSEVDIFDIRKSSMEDVETFGTSSSDTFLKNKKGEKGEKGSLESDRKTQRFPVRKSASMDKGGKTLREIDQGSFELFSDQTTENIETFGVDTSILCKSTNTTLDSNVKNKETRRSTEDDTSLTPELTTRLDGPVTLTGPLLSTQIATMSAIGTTSSSVTNLTQSTMGNTHSSQVKTNSTENCVTLEKSFEKTVSMDTPQDQSVTMDTPQDQSVSMDSRQDQSVSMDTPQDQSVTIDTPQDQSVTMDIPQDKTVSMDIPQYESVTTDIPQDQSVTTDTPQDESVTMDAPQDEGVTMDTPQDESVTMDTPQDQSVSIETPQDKNGMESPEKTKSEDCKMTDEASGESHLCQKLEKVPYNLIPIDLPAYAQKTTVNMNNNSNISIDEKEHTIITDAPASPNAMDTPFGPNSADCIASPMSGPIIIPISPEKTFCSPDVKTCVIIPLEVSGTSPNSSGISQDAKQVINSSSPRQRQVKRKICRTANSSFLSDPDSDEEKLMIDVSSLEESDDTDVCSSKKRQDGTSELASKDTNVTENNYVERNSSFYDKSIKKDGRRSTRVTRSRQSLDTIMAQMKNSSSDKEKQQLTDDMTSQKIDKTMSDNLSCQEKEVLGRRTRSKSEVSLVSVAVEKRSGIISGDITVSTLDKAKKESDSDSCVSMDVDVKSQGYKVRRRSTRLSTGSSSSYSEVKDTDSTVIMDSKVPVTRKRGRSTKSQTAQLPEPPAEKEESRLQQKSAETDATMTSEVPVPVKKRRGRPPKQKVEVGKNADTSSNAGTEIEIKQESIGNSSKSSVQEGSKVKASTVKSTRRKSTEKDHASRVIPKMVATLIPKSEETICKKPSVAEKSAGPKTGTRRASAKVSTFDSILKGMQNMLHTPDQNVKESQSQTQETSSSTFLQPDSKSNVSYHLWSLGGFQVVVRCGYHGTVRDNVQKLSKVHLCTKMEYQSSEGLEQTTPSEACRTWISGYIRPQCKILRARIDPLKSELIALEDINLTQLIASQQTIRPGEVFLMLQNIFHKLHLQPPGQYLLHHSAGDKNCNIKKSTDKKKRGSYDLHFQHFGFMASNTSRRSVQWLPVDPAIILPSHLTKGRIPATFEPADFTIPPKKNKGKKKKKQNRK
ncbi:serine-rich adhesin for platelets-like isoform X2 [Argopecten irradians]|uniref:serine-rich adhesin for platelets-like isoform X2 n=1 Tax=Argopecten irradians TaxID=31199 RepID=UPI00371440E5